MTIFLSLNQMMMVTFGPTSSQIIVISYQIDLENECMCT